MWTQSPSKSAEKGRLTILVLAHSRILQRKEVLSFSTNIYLGGPWEELNSQFDGEPR